MTLEQKILKAIEQDPKCANSDKRLLVRIWQMEGLQLTQEQLIKFVDVSTPESVTRARRKLTQERLINPPESVTKAREQRFKEELDKYSNYNLMKVKGIYE